VQGTWKGGPLLVTPKDMLSKATEMEVCFHRGGTWRDGFLALLREGINFFI